MSSSKSKQTEPQFDGDASSRVFAFLNGMRLEDPEQLTFQYVDDGVEDLGFEFEDGWSTEVLEDLPRQQPLEVRAVLIFTFLSLVLRLFTAEFWFQDAEDDISNYLRSNPKFSSLSTKSIQELEKQIRMDKEKKKLDVGLQSTFSLSFSFRCLGREFCCNEDASESSPEAQDHGRRSQRSAPATQFLLELRFRSPAVVASWSLCQTHDGESEGCDIQHALRWKPG